MSARLTNLWSVARGHLGDDVSALVDGQLPPAEAERAWAHVMTCTQCRRLVESEGWLKQQLGSLGGPDRLSPLTAAGAAYDHSSWMRADAVERRQAHRGRRVVAAGFGTAVVGVAAFTSAGISPVSMSATMTRDTVTMVSSGVEHAAEALAGIAR